MCFLAHNEEKEEPDEDQNRTSGQGQCASAEKYERKAGKHDYKGDNVNNHCVFTNVHNALPIFVALIIPQALIFTKYYLIIPLTALPDNGLDGGQVA
jgi:hypothetical protein